MLEFRHRVQHPPDGYGHITQIQPCGGPQIRAQLRRCLARAPRTVRVVVTQSEQTAPLQQGLFGFANAAHPERERHQRREPAITEPVEGVGARKYGRGC